MWLAAGREGSTSPQFTLLCTSNRTQKIEECFLYIFLEQNGTVQLSTAHGPDWAKAVLEDSRAEWDIQGLL